MGRIKLIDILAIVVSLIPFAVYAIVRPSLPDRIPIHWNVSGDVDGWTSRDQLPMFLGTMAALGFALYLLTRFMKKLDPKRSARVSETTAARIGFGIVVFMCAINCLILAPGLGKFNMTTTLVVMVSLLYTFLGNLMYNIKPNYFIGIRLPWTLESDDNWRRTHRLAGAVWFVGGLVSATLAMFIEPKIMFIVFMSITATLVLVPGIYSFVIFRQSTSGSHSD
ncbi:SdpI family protein [Chryseolinea sp. T2]|uniref:SdpI family protein n=1 Tax=Chryseolinea sp. T2 TaxID=3129255 RepID=UPI003077A231